jgi:hypothetical protein
MEGLMTPLLTDPELLSWLARMRAETPLWVDEIGGRHVFRHADMSAIVADPRRFSSDFGRLMPFLGQDKISVNLMWADPPAHRPLRGLVSQAFTPAAIHELPRVGSDVLGHETEFYGPRRLPVSGVRSRATALHWSNGDPGSVR